MYFWKWGSGRWFLSIKCFLSMYLRSRFGVKLEYFCWYVFLTNELVSKISDIPSLVYLVFRISCETKLIAFVDRLFPGFYPLHGFYLHTIKVPNELSKSLSSPSQHFRVGYSYYGIILTYLNATKKWLRSLYKNHIMDNIQPDLPPVKI